MEKKESKKSESKGVPLYLVVLLMILAFAVAIAFVTWTKPVEKLNPVQPPIDSNKTDRLSGYFLYSKNCKICSKGNSFLGILEKNGIGGSFEKIDINSIEGKKLLESLPEGFRETQLLFIEKNSIMDSMRLNLGEKSQRLSDWLYQSTFPQSEDFFIIPEMDFNRGKSIVLMPETQCGSSNLVHVYLFQDPFSPTVFKTLWNEKEIDKNFAKNIEIEHRFVLSDDSNPIIENNGNEKTTLFLKYLSCIKDNEELEKFEQKAYSLYCGVSEQRVFEPYALQNCGESGHYAIPLSDGELAKIVDELKLDSDKIRGDCVPNAAAELGLSKALADKFNINSVPKAVVNCKYRGGIQDLKKMICAVNPKLEGCA